MSWFCSKHWPRGYGVLGAAIMLALVAVFVAVWVGTQSVTAHAAQSDAESLALFAQMMPVFTSPRCLGCHGAVDPASDATHVPGKVDVILEANGDMHTCCDEIQKKNTCIECHTDSSSAWRTAPRAMSFVGKDALTLCRQIKISHGITSDPESGRAFVSHLKNDELIGYAFVGRGAIGADSAFAPIKPEPPPMSRAELLTAARSWIRDGHGGCGTVWNGTITVTRTSSEHDVQQANKVTLDSARDLTISLKIVDSQAVATVHYEAHDFVDSDARPNGCSNFRHTTYAADGNGDADYQIMVEDPASDAPVSPGEPGPEPGRVSLFFSAPAVNGTNTLEDRNISACPPVPRASPYVYPESHLSAEGPVDPKDPDHLVGKQGPVKDLDGMTTTITWDLLRGDTH